MSHSVFKDQKIIFNVICFAFEASLSALKRRVRYVIDSLSSTAFFKLFFRTIYSTFSALPKHRFLRWSGGQGRSYRLYRQPRFSIIFRTISRSNSANFAARFVVNKAGDSTHIKKPRNFFLSFFFIRLRRQPHIDEIRHAIPICYGAMSPISERVNRAVAFGEGGSHSGSHRDT